MEPNPIKITINYNANSPVEIQQWPLVTGVFVERDRVSAEVNGMSYSLILDPKDPRVEVWDTDENGEINNLVAHYGLPSRPILPILRK